jgi:predicted esterase
MKENYIKVTRTARYITLGSPASDTRQIWFCCHGYRQLAKRFLRRFRALDDGSRVLVAPEGLSRFYVDQAPGPHGPEHRVGASWMTREDRLNEIEDYVRYLDAVAERFVPQSPHARQVVLGFSQGVHTVSRWVTRGTVHPSRLVLWGAYFPPDLDMEAAARALDGVTLTLVRGHEDATISDAMEAAAVARLEGWGIAYEVDTHPGGHDIDEALLKRIAAREGSAAG